MIQTERFFVRKKISYTKLENNDNNTSTSGEIITYDGVVKYENVVVFLKILFTLKMSIL